MVSGHGVRTCPDMVSGHGVRTWCPDMVSGHVVLCVLCTVYCVLCTVCTVYCVYCVLLCTAVYCVLCSVYCVMCTVCCVLRTTYYVLRTWLDMARHCTHLDIFRTYCSCLLFTPIVHRHTRLPSRQTLTWSLYRTICERPSSRATRRSLRPTSPSHLMSSLDASYAKVVH